MKTKIPKDQYANDFKQVVLYNSVYAIHRYFADDPNQLIDSLKRYAEVKRQQIRIPDEEFHALLQKIERFNFGFSLPTAFVKAMFHTNDGKQQIGEFIQALTDSKQIKVLNSGVLKTKTATIHFAKRYVYNLKTLMEIFADKERLSKALNFTSDFYTKRQYKFISKLKNEKQMSNENEQVFLFPNRRYTKRRPTKAQIKAMNADIPEEDEVVEPAKVATPKKEEVHRIEATPETIEAMVSRMKRRSLEIEIQKRMKPYLEKYIHNEISKEEMDATADRIRKELTA